MNPTRTYIRSIAGLTVLLLTFSACQKDESVVPGNIDNATVDIFQTDQTKEYREGNFQDYMEKWDVIPRPIDRHPGLDDRVYADRIQKWDIIQANPERAFGTWDLIEMHGTAIQLRPEDIPFIQIKGHSLTGFTGCNTMSANIALQQGSFVLSGFGMTRIHCPYRAHFEREFIRAFDSIDVFHLVQDEMRLQIKDHDVLIFRKRISH